MAENGNVTPEKQLLKLIEDGGSGRTSAAGAVIKRKGISVLSAGALRGALFGRLSFFKRGAKKKMGAASRAKIDFALVNRILFVCVAALLVFLSLDVARSWMALKHPPNFGLEQEKALGGPGPQVSQLKDEAYYLQKVSSRDLFRERKAPAEKKKAAPIVEASFGKSLSLVGISMSANPDAIIEDKEKQKTYFVKRGQMIGDDIKVVAISKEKVILSKDEQEFELR